MTRLSAMAFINAIGNGLFISLNALYFTQVVGISVRQLGVGLALGALLGVLLGIPAGRVIDRLTPQRAVAGIWLLLAAGMATYAFVRSEAAFFALVPVVVAFERIAGVAYRLLIADAIPDDQRVRGRAQLRALANTGMGLGAGLGALVLAIGTVAAFTGGIFFNVATFLAPAFMALNLPPHRKSRGLEADDATPSTNRSPWRDWPFVAISALSMLMAFQFGVLETGLPLWIARHTSAPVAAVGVSLVVNTVIVAALQVRLSSGTESLHRAGTLCLRAGLLLAAAMVLYAILPGRSSTVAVGLLAVGVVVHSIAEIWYSAGTTALSYDLAPKLGGGAYHGLFQSGYQTALLLCPIVLTNLVLPGQEIGWLGLGVMFAVSGLLLWQIPHRVLEPEPRVQEQVV